jgi:hypothetical protein
VTPDPYATDAVRRDDPHEDAHHEDAHHDDAHHEDDAASMLQRAAEAMGVDIDHDEAHRWIAAMSAEASGDLTVDVDSGIYGHRVILADHDPADLVRFRRIAGLVGIEDRPPQVVTALALSGSAAQNRIHRFPADIDFFERVHIRADTQEEACAILADVVRTKALATLRGTGHRLQEVKFGNWPEDVIVAGAAHRHGTPISWSPAWVEAGAIPVEREDGSVGQVHWDDVAGDPGWCKLDWLVADPDGHGLVNTSSVLDPTWEGPDGTIVALDGFLDPYFQEVYLETGSLPVFTRLVREMGADAVAEYVERLTGEVCRYTVDERNYGKAARRLYNIFRITGRYVEAAYIRELFDEPVTALYQLAGLLRALDEAAEDPGDFDADAMVAQVDQLIMSAIAALEGPEEAEMVRRLLRLRDALSGRADDLDRSGKIAGMRADALHAVNEYFERVLTAIPSIQEYLDGVAATYRGAAEAVVPDPAPPGAGDELR